MEPKNLVVKSKSSNTALSSKPIPSRGSNTNKKSWSSARFKDVNSKKRGVYVEKKTAINTVTQATQGPSDVPKAPRRPRRGEKNFITSCLSILSKETAATQFPEDETLKPSRGRKIIRRVIAETVDKGTQDLDAIYSDGNSSERIKSSTARRPAPESRLQLPLAQQRKPRFRSKALCENFNDKKLIVLQSKKAFERSLLRNNSSGSKFGNEGVSQPKKPFERSLLRNNSSGSKFGNEGGSQPKKPFERSLERNNSPGSKFGKNGQKNVLERPDTLAIQGDEVQDKEKDDEKKKVSENAQSEVTTESKTLKKVLRTEDKSSKQSDSVNSEVISTESKKVKKVLRIEEPNTLISDYDDKNKSLYNFFVDLLETTCNVYNVDSEYNRPPSATFEIDEKVAEKLKINEPRASENTGGSNYARMPVNLSNEPSRKLYFVTDDGVTDKITVYQAGPNCCGWNPPTVKPKKSRSPYRCDRRRIRRCRRETYGNDYRSNLKCQSFLFSQQLKFQAAAKAQSLVMPKKTVAYKKYKKRNLLSILKEELKLDDDYFEEPENMHQALSIIVRNKKRAQKAMHMDDPSVAFSMIGKRSCADSSVNCFKRRKVICSSTKSPKRNTRIVGKTGALCHKYSMMNSPERLTVKKTEPIESDECSVHSIEVRAYDYEPDQYIQRVHLADETMVYTSYSGVSLRSETINSSKEYVSCLQKCGRSLSPTSTNSAPSTNISQLLLRDIYNMY